MSAPAEAGARALIAASISLAEHLCESIDAVRTALDIFRHLDRDLDDLAHHVVPLADALREAEAVLCSDPVRQLAKRGQQEDRNLDLWLALYETLTQCQRSITHVHNALEPIDPDNDELVQQKLELRNLIGTATQQIKLHGKSLRMAVQMINLRLSTPSSSIIPIHTGMAVDRLRVLMEMQISVLREMSRNPTTRENFEKLILREYTRSVSFAAQTLLSAASGTRRDSGVATCCSSRNGSCVNDRHASLRSASAMGRPSVVPNEDTSRSSIAVTTDDARSSIAHTEDLVPGRPVVRREFSSSTAPFSDYAERLSIDNNEEILSQKSPGLEVIDADIPTPESQDCPSVDECLPPPCDYLAPELPPTPEEVEPLPAIKLCNESERYFYEEALRLAGYDVRSRHFDATGAMEKIFDRCRKQGLTPDEEMAGMFKVLLDSGADPRQPVASVWKYFQKMQPIGWRPKQECNFLIAATVEGWDLITGAFVERGMPLDTGSPAPLHVATREGNMIIVRQLIAAGADTRVRARGNITPMHIAAETGRIEILTELISSGALIDEVGFWQSGTKFECTPLHLAVKKQHVEVVKLLLDSGADVDGKAAKTPERSPPPLHLACQEVRPDLVKLLLEHGANPNIEDSFGSTPLAQVRACLSLKSKAPGTKDLKKLRKDCEEITKMLVQIGATPDLQVLEKSSLEAEKSWSGYASDSGARLSLRKTMFRRRNTGLTTFAFGRKMATEPISIDPGLNSSKSSLAPSSISSRG